MSTLKDRIEWMHDRTIEIDDWCPRDERKILYGDSAALKEYVDEYADGYRHACNDILRLIGPDVVNDRTCRTCSMGDAENDPCQWWPGCSKWMASDEGVEES